jgi:hypothetical protein
MGNSETGRGKTFIRGFFYRDYCTNGCVFGSEDAFEFSRTHLGGRLLDGIDYEIMSDTSKALEDKAIVSQVSDVMHALADREFHQKMADRLRSLTHTSALRRPVAAMQQLAKDMDLSQSETDQALTNLLTDNDLTQWGAVNAVTRLANDAEDYERANELEKVGAAIIDLNRNQWTRYAELETVAA